MSITGNFSSTTSNVANFSDLGGSGYSFESLSGIPFTEQTTGSGFGVVDFVSGHATKKLTSRTVINTVDLLGEGQIEGLVSGEYQTSGTIGATGYTSAEFIPFGGFPENQLRSIYLNEVSIVSAGQDEKNYYNFQNYKYALSDGEPQGIHKDDNFLNVSNATKTQKTKTINERAYGPESDGKTYAKNFRIFNKNISAFEINLKIPALSYLKVGKEFTREEQNEQVGSELEFQVEYRSIHKDGSAGGWLWNGNSITKMAGLISSPFMFSINVIPDYNDSSIDQDSLVGWEFKITRLTLDSINTFVQNESYIDSTTEVFQSTLSYPNSAILSSRFDAEFFGSVPNRAFDLRLLKVKIPSNYDPATRTYYGDWDGTFSTEDAGPFGKNGNTYVGATRALGKHWTDNPAWVFYDLVTNRRYGLGKYIKSLNVDKWTLYKIAQYCDVMVDNGEESVEPRFSCNVLINTREDAFKVLQDFASIFRGIVYYGMGGLQAIQDREKEPIIQFNASNVEEGNFNYASTAKKTRFSVAIVRYNDKNNFFKPALEYVEDVEAIRKHGIRETELTAFGCTSKTQAVRLGRWVLHTNNYEQETVSFAAGMDSLLVRPGDLIQISDKNRGTNLEGGRLIDINSTGVALDRLVSISPSNTYSLTLTTPTYFYDTSLLSDDNTFDSSDAADLRRGQITKTDFTTSLGGWTFETGVIGTGVGGPISGTVIGFPNGTVPSSYEKETGVTWALDNNAYEPEYYNVLDVREMEDAVKYEIIASKHYTGKFAAIESGVTFTPRDPNVIGTATPPPAPLKITGALGTLTTNSKKIDYAIDVPTGANSSIEIGNTAFYNVYMKTGAAWNSSSTDSETGDFIANTVPPIPRNELKIETIEAATSNVSISKQFIPATNTGYHFLCYAFNAAGIPSNSFVESPGITVSNHYPIRDVSIHSLRLTTDDAGNQSKSKGVVINPATKDQTFTWDASFLDGTPPMEIDYRITIREPVPDSQLTGTILGGAGGTFTSSQRLFDFNFLKNYAITNGPFRHYDIAVEARDKINGGYSTDAASPPISGYDIAEVNNVRPSGYWLTPRDTIMGGGRPGLCENNEDLCTEQYLTSDGKVYVSFRQLGDDLLDIAGGYIYLSAQPFSSYEDFTSAPSSPLGGLTGLPANDNSNTLIGQSRYQRLGIDGSNGTDTQRDDAKIVKVPFLEPTLFSDCDCDGNLRTNNIIVVSPDYQGFEAPNHFNFDRAYYMAISFFDSFDYATSGQSAGSKPWDTGIWVGFARPHVNYYNNNTNYNTHPNSGFYTGTDGALLTEDDFAAFPLRQGETPSTANSYVMTAPWTGAGGAATRSEYTGFSGCRVYPTKFTSAASSGPYHAWVRMNVNGIWEGNGVERVRILTKKDVEYYYNYKGFYEYQCVMEETEVSQNVWYPNRIGDSFACRFSQGQIQTSGPTAGMVDNVGGLNVNTSVSNYGSNTASISGLRVGVPQFWQSDTYVGDMYSGGGNYSGDVQNDENITSYNETGAEVMMPGMTNITGTKPLHGFRRFRVYFDPNNLPAPNIEGQLASYTVLGINAWNGKYTSWPAANANVQNDLLFARDGTEIFSANTVQTWLDVGDVTENIPGVWNHHPAGFGQGYGGLIKTRNYFDVHLGRLIDDSYLEEAFFGVVTTNDYTTALKSVDWNAGASWWSRYDDALGLDYYHVQSYDGSLSSALSGWYSS